MKSLFVIAIALLAFSVATPLNPYYAPTPYHTPYHPQPTYYHQPANYQYGYAVRDDYHGTNFGASEQRTDYGTSGEYHVALPDGRIQTVKYTADDYNGFVADVSYSGQARYDPAPYHPAPYHPAPYHPSPYHG